MKSFAPGIAEDNILHVLRNHVGSTTWEHVLVSWIFRSDDLVKYFASKLADIPHVLSVRRAASVLAPTGTTPRPGGRGPRTP